MEAVAHHQAITMGMAAEDAMTPTSDAHSHQRTMDQAAMDNRSLTFNPDHTTVQLLDLAPSLHMTTTVVLMADSSSKDLDPFHHSTTIMLLMALRMEEIRSWREQRARRP